MKSCLALTLIGGIALMASAAHAQSTVSPGGSVSGSFTSQDEKLGDDTFYRCYTINTAANTTYVVTLESETFDAYLAVGQGSDCQELALSNDDGPEMGTNSQVRFASDGGTWTIRANTLNANEEGPFKLSVSAGERVVLTRDILPLTLGASMTGELSYGDRKADDGSFYDCYRLQMRSQDTLAIRVDSDEYDAFLGLYSGGTCEGEPLATDDDSGGGTNAQVVKQLAAGTYSIRANSLNSDAVGAYAVTATVRR